jgi:3'(2'), 5'-bisphosphate nucleotidase
MQELLSIAIKAAIDAGKEILEIYHTDDFGIQTKKDDSPLTKADLAANKVIIEYLEKSKIPILSEEACDISYEERKDWKLFWLVDPLDGTKEFIKKNDEFTVNIALIKENTPIAGVVYAPVLETLYFAGENIGAFKIQTTHFSSWEENLAQAVSLPLDLPQNYTVVGSRSHMNEETTNYLEALRKKYQKIEIISKGSSLKLCMVAEGSAHEYPRFGPTMEWDTAAGHAIAKYAKAIVTQGDGKTDLIYNKENLLNPWFIIKHI